MRRKPLIFNLCALALASVAPLAAARGQLMSKDYEPRRMVSLLAGGFIYDFEGDRTFPMAALRGDWPLSRYILTEVGVTFARAEVEHFLPEGDSRPGIGFGPAVFEEDSNIFTATVGLQAQLPLRYVHPYVGIASGLFIRMDPPGGQRFARPTQAFATGVRIPLTRRFGLRGELRYRLDQHQGAAGTASNFEETLGVSWSF